MLNMPRPWVMQIRVSPLHTKSSTEQLVGPSFVADQLAPPSSLANRPTSVPRYTKSVWRGWTVTARTGAAGRPAPMPAQVAPPSSLRQTLSAARHQLRCREAELRNREDQIRARDQELRSVYASRSWRWAGPMRRASRLVKRLKAG